MEAAAAMAVFVGSHVLIARTGLKPLLVARLGRQGYLAAYSALSVVLLAWVVTAILAADRIALWPAPAWAYPFAVVVSAVAFVLIGIGAVIRNPLSIGFRAGGFDPDRPGVVGWVRHPLIWGFALWGVAHVPANGVWPSIVLFAGSAGFGILGARAVDRRMRARFGDEAWRPLATAPGRLDGTAIAGALIGLAVWAGMLWLHPLLFGVDPWAVTRAVVSAVLGGS